MSQEWRRFRRAGFAVLLLAGGFATLAGPAEAARGSGFSGGFHGRSVATGAPAHSGFARPFPARGPAAIGPVPPLQSGFLGRGFIPPLVGPPVFPAQRFGLHRHGFRHRFAFNHRFPFGHCFAFGDCFGAFAGFGFDDAFLDPPVADTELAAPSGPVVPLPSAPSADLAEQQDQEPVSAHIVQFNHPQRAEEPAGRHEDSGKVIVMRPGFRDEAVTVPRDGGGG